MSSVYAGSKLAAARAAAAGQGHHHRLRDVAGVLILAALVAAVTVVIVRVRKRRARKAGGTGTTTQSADDPHRDPDDAAGEPQAAGPRSLLYRIGLWSAQHKVIVLVLWLALLGAAAAGSHALGGVYADNFTLSSTSAQQGANLLHAHRPTAGGQGGQLVFNVRSGALVAHQGAIEAR